MPGETGAARSAGGRRGRRPGGGSSREEILDAARRQFAERGYAGATMRSIAAKAGVDAALVVHFFGSKAALLGEAIQWPFDPSQELPKLLADGRRGVGRNLVALALRTWDSAESRHPLLTLLRAATTEPRAAEMIADLLRTRLLGPLLEELGSDRPGLRADLVASQIVGLAMARHVLRLETLASAPQDEVIAAVGPSIQRYLTGKIE